MARKHRQCPKCKGKKGFKMPYTISGYGHEDRTFNGKVLDVDRVVIDDIERFAECLECEYLIETEKLEV